MLAVTIVWIFVAMTNADIIWWMLRNEWLFYVSIAISFVIMCGMMCFVNYFRVVPFNYILLLVYTISHSYMISAIAVGYDQDAVIAAAISTFGMFIALTAYACFSRKDITKLGGALSTASMMVVCFCILFWAL